MNQIQVPVPNDGHAMDRLSLLSPRVTSGVLFVTVLSCNKLFHPDTVYYCNLEVEHQHVRTSTIPAVDGVVEWNQSVNFDISNPTSKFFLVVWGRGKGAVSKIGSCFLSIGQLMPGQDILHKFDITPESSIELCFKMSHGVTKVSECDFLRLKTIGKGSFGTVYLVKKKDTGNLYAMKVLLKQTVVEKNAVKHTINERQILKQVDHPFIVSLKFAFQTDDHLFMVMPYMNGGELFFHLSEGDDVFSEERAKFYAAEITMALGYMHDNGILYRDLKPENILLDMEGHISIVDFGLSKTGIYNGDTTSTFCGSLEYMPPELLAGKPYSNVVDWWALATMTYEMIAGLPPFWDDVQAEMLENIAQCDLSAVEFDKSMFSPECIDFVSKILIHAPEKRLGYGLNATEDIKSHPWFADVDWVKIYNKQVTPPFKPHVRGEFDMRYFDQEVLAQDPSKLDYRKIHRRLELNGAFDDFNFESLATPKSQRS